MMIKRALDDDGCIDLLAVMRIMNQISQEQAWALAYELAALMQRLWPAGNNCALIENLAQIHINQEGYIHPKSLLLAASASADKEKSNKSTSKLEAGQPDEAGGESANRKKNPADCQHLCGEDAHLSNLTSSSPRELQDATKESTTDTTHKTSTQPLPPTPPITPELNETLKRRRPAASEAELVSSLGIALFWALDYGIAEDEERKLSAAMEYLIMQSQNPEGHLSLAKLQEICIKRLPVPTKPHADLYYRAICKSLISDTIELSLLLDKIYTAKLYAAAAAQQHLHLDPHHHHHSKHHLLDNLDQDDLSELGLPLASLRALKINDWARLWMQVIRELRQRRKFTQIQFENECEA